MIMVARMGLLFWKNEEAWSMNWIGKESPGYISAKFFERRLQEILRDRKAAVSTKKSPQLATTLGVLPTKSRTVLQGVVIQEPVAT